MKNTSPPLSSLILIFFFIFVLCLGGCGSQNLSRSEAQRLIEAGTDFRQPFALELMQGETLLPYGKSLAILESGEETPAQAADRKIREYYEKNSQIAVAAYLGLVEARVKTLDSEQPKRSGWNSNLRWGFEEDYLATEKGKDLWKAYDLPPTEKSVLLAGKQIVEVTGIAKTDETRAAAQFIWKYAPNEAGRAFDTSTAEFKALPVDVQRLLDGTLPPSAIVSKRENKTMSFASIRQGEALFRRYDDGWRLEAVLFR